MNIAEKYYKSMLVLHFERLNTKICHFQNGDMLTILPVFRLVFWSNNVPTRYGLLHESNVCNFSASKYCLVRSDLVKSVQALRKTGEKIRDANLL